MQPGMFWTNLYEFFPPQLKDDVLEVALPCKRTTAIPGVDVADLGPAVREIFLQPQRWNGRTIQFFSEVLTPQDMADELADGAPRAASRG